MILVDSTIATPETKQKARAALEAVKLSRGTNLAAGLLLGLKLQMAAAKADKEQADEPNSQGSSNSHLYRMHAVLLCTDGHPTAGLKTRADILSAQQEVLFPSPEGTARPQDRKARRVLAPVHTHCIPVSQWPSATPARTLWPTAVDWRSKEPSKPNKPFVKVICFGFGEDHNPYLLGDIAMNGGGSYFFVRSPHDVAPAITDSLGATLLHFVCLFVPHRGRSVLNKVTSPTSMVYSLQFTNILCNCCCMRISIRPLHVGMQSLFATRYP